MKGFVTYSILCDGDCCGNHHDVTRHITARVNLSDVRREAKKAGWLVIQQAEKKCFCPECAKAYKFKTATA